MNGIKKSIASLLFGTLMMACMCTAAAAAEKPAAVSDMAAASVVPAATASKTALTMSNTAVSAIVPAATVSQPTDAVNNQELLIDEHDETGQNTEETERAADDKSIGKKEALALAVYYLYSPVSSQNMLPDDYYEFDFIPLYDDDKAIVARYVKFSNDAFIIINNNKENAFVAEYGMAQSSTMIDFMMERYPEMEIIYDGWHGVRGRDFDVPDVDVVRNENNYHACFPQAGQKDETQMEILSNALAMINDEELKIDEKWMHEKVIDAFIRRLYDTCLGRIADKDGFAAWKNALDNGARASKVIKGFFYSDEYIAKNKESMQYIMDLYMAFVGRVFDAKGYQSWSEAMYYGATRDQVFRGFARSEEFKKWCLENGLTP